MRWNRLWILGCGTLFICTFFIQATNLPGPGKQDKPLRTIVIDAGHGGTDVGARGSYSTEKQVSLEVALKLGKILEENMPDVKVVYTRKTDRFDDPRRKAEIANNARGDLFISIHCNSAPKTRHVTGYRTVYRKKGKRKVAVKQPIYAYSPSQAQGTETYVWATSKNNAKLESLKESSVMVLDANSEEAKEVMDAADPETFIMLNTLRNAFFDQSLRLSTMVEDEFTKVGRISRGARQRNEKGIWVLQATAMPSVLVELGFISNPDEEEYLNSANGQEEAATCIYKAVKRYKEELERFGNFKEEVAPAPTPVVPEPTMQPVIETSYKESAKSTVTSAAAPSNVRYRVQLLVSDKKYSARSSIFKKLGSPVEQEAVILNSKRFNKYIWGNFKTEPEAGAALRKAKQLGFHDAFVVPYKNGLRLDTQL
jgi:N-acetylmuramoyl-L-alanine amidase